MAESPAERGPSSGGELHDARDVAESFGADAGGYDRSRPRYPEAMVQAIVAASPGSEVLDVGMGTGIAARQFQAAGCDVLGVEVDARMADFARAGGLGVEVARFEEWDPAGRTFDTVIAGQAWHWVDPVAGATQAARVLRPGGRLAVFWNVFQLPAELREAVDRAHREILSEGPFLRGESGGIDAYSPQFVTAADGIRSAGGFDEPEQWRFDWQRSYTKDEWLEQIPTYGGYNQLRPEQLQELLTALGRVVDAVGGAFTMEYAAVVITARRRQDHPVADGAPGLRPAGGDR